MAHCNGRRRVMSSTNGAPIVGAREGTLYPSARRSMVGVPALFNGGGCEGGDAVGAGGRCGPNAQAPGVGKRRRSSGGFSTKGLGAI